MTDDRWREWIEDAVARALEAGVSAADVKAEVEYVIGNIEDEA